MTPDELAELMRARLADRSVVVALDWLEGSLAFGDMLSDLGADVVGRLAATGELDALDADVRERTRLLPIRGDDMMGGILAWDAAFAAPDPLVTDALDELDPDHRAEVLLPFWSTPERVDGRGVLGARDPAWIALDDKLVVDAVWDAAGIDRAPSRIVSSRVAGDLFEAHDELSTPLGTIWASDNRDGWHGGAGGLRWVAPTRRADFDEPAGAFATDEDLQHAWAWVGARADRVRIMPFLDGVPCSIHALVTAEEHIATFRPCEMVVLRDLATHRLRYGGASTSWEPSPADTEAMRETARRVGRHLRDELDYRGFLTIDGVMTADGFLPTELNPRYGAALSAQARHGELPLFLLHLLVIDGRRGGGAEPSWQPEAVEALVRASAAEGPSAGGHLLLDGVAVDEPRTTEVTVDGHACEVQLSGTISGARLRVDVVPAPVGPPAGPLLAKAFRAAGDAVGLALPELAAAPSLR